MKLYITLVFTLLLYVSTKAQLNQFEHLNRYQQPVVDFSVLTHHVIKQTSDKGYVFCRGTRDTNQLPSAHYLELIKCNREGNIMWVKSIDRGTNAVSYNFSSVTITSRQEILLASSYFENDGKMVGTIIKVDSTGQQIWAKKYASQLNVNFREILVLEQGNLLAIGTISDSSNTGVGFVLDSLTTEYGFVLKTDSLGEPIWNKILKIPGERSSSLNSIKMISSTDFIISGSSGKKALALKMNDSGSVLWSKGFFDYNARFEDCEMLSDGNCLFTGWKRNLDFSQNICFVKINTLGTVLWKKGQQLSPFQSSTGYSNVAVQNGFVFTGYFHTPIPTGVLGKINLNGDFVWAKHFRSNFQNFNYLPSTVITTTDGGLAFYVNDVGTYTASLPTHCSAFLKTDNNGIISCEPLSGNFTLSNIAESVDTTIEDSTLVFTFVSYSPTIVDITILDTTLCQSINDPHPLNVNNKNESELVLKAYPNPSLGETTITFNLYEKAVFLAFELSDISNKIIKYDVIENPKVGEQNIKLNLNLSPGIYFYSIICDGKRTTSKLLITK